MTHSLYLFFNDYNSWQYVVTAFGLVFVGGVLASWKVYFLPLLILGETMLIALINNQVSVDNLQGAVGGMASVYPIIFAAICMIIDFRILEKHLPKGKEKTEEKPEDETEEKPAETPQKPQEISGAFDKSQFNKRK
jgi:hypothetical protein